MLQRLFRQDMFMRITAVLLAIVLWLQLTVEQTQSSTRTFEVKLSAAAAPADYEDLEPIRESVQVTVEGPLRLLERVKASDLGATVNLGGAAGLGRTSVDVQVRLSGNNALQVRSVSPDRLPINLVKIERATRPLVVATQPTIQGDVRYSVIAGVANVTLTGPKARLAQVQQVVLTVDYTVFKQTTDVSLTPKALDAEGSPVPIAITPADIPVQVRVDHVSPGHSIPVKAEFQGTLPTRYTLDYTVSPANVTVYGLVGMALPDLSQVLTVPIVVSEHAGNFTQQAALGLPKGMFAEPSLVTVDVNITEALEQRAYQSQPIRVDEVADQLLVDTLIDPVSKAAVREVQVVLSGTKEALDQVTPANLQPFVVATRQGVGTVLLPIKLRLPPGVTEVRLTPAQVNLTLVRR